MKETDQRLRYGAICSIVGIVLNLLLFAFKLLAGLLSNAVSIMADAVNNLSDAGSSLVTLLGFRLAAQKPDKEHPYGHGRMEYISALIVSMIIILMGADLLKSSVQKIITPEAVEFSVLTCVILIAAIAVKCIMAAYNTYFGNKIGSAALKATAKDSLSDCIATSVVLFCVLLGRYTGINLDGWAGVLVSLFIFYAGYSAAKEALSPLLGNAPEEEFIEQIEEIVLNFDPNILGLHDLMVHDYGPGRCILSLHAEVPANGDIMKLHDIVDNLERKLCEDLSCTATIHMDPIVTDDPEVNRLRELVSQLAAEIHEGITTHDFRMVQGDTHTNLIFDMAVPFSCKLTDSEVTARAEALIAERIGSHYYAVIDIDRDNYINR